MFQSLRFAIWGGDYALGEVDANGDYQVHEIDAIYEAPVDIHGRKINGVAGVDYLTNNDFSDDDLADIDATHLADIDEALSATESEPINPDPADRLPPIPHPDFAPDGLLKRKLSRTSVTMRDRSWKQANPLYRRHRRLARRTSASLMEAIL